MANKPYYPNIEEAIRETDTKILAYFANNPQGTLPFTFEFLNEDFTKRNRFSIELSSEIETSDDVAEALAEGLADGIDKMSKISERAFNSISVVNVEAYDSTDDNKEKEFVIINGISAIPANDEATDFDISTASKAYEVIKDTDGNKSLKLIDGFVEQVMAENHDHEHGDDKFCTRGLIFNFCVVPLIMLGITQAAYAHAKDNSKAGMKETKKSTLALTEQLKEHYDKGA